MKSPDDEEQKVVALLLVIDRSGSMSGQKIEICPFCHRILYYKQSLVEHDDIQ